MTADFLIRKPQNAAEGARRIHRYCVRIVSTLGIRWEVSGSPANSGAVVTNHLSYLDILLFAAAQPCVMVAKAEVRGWPLIGWLTRQAGTVYVVRGGGPPTWPATDRAMAEAFCIGLPVLFFPEGTTTNGSTVLPFRRGLMHSVLREGVSLAASAICYSSDKVCWYGDALLLPHLLALARMDGIRGQIRFGKSVLDRRDRFRLALNAHEQVTELYRQLKSANLSHEHAALTHHPKDLLDRPIERVGTLDDHGCVLS